MEGDLRLLLLSIVVVMMTFIIAEFILRKKKFKKQNPTVIHEEPRLEPLENKPVSEDSLIIISIMAKADKSFESYELFQAIAATGMIYGEMKIFHYYVPTAFGKSKLFSLASATKPGEFEVDKIGDFSCRGLTLFTDLSNVEDPEEAFELMYATAEQLAEDLDGELRAGPINPLTDAALEQFQAKIALFKKNVYA